MENNILRKVYFHKIKNVFRRYFFLFLIIFCIQPHHVFCQPIENYFIQYTIKDGLADGNIGSIIQDSKGFLWIGTENGLCRFDGHSFKTYRYNSMDTNSLRENQIRRLFIDSKKRLWIMTFHWIYLYHPNGEWFEHFSVNSSSDDKFDKICGEENNQLIIIGSASVYKFDMIRKKFFFFYQKGMMPPANGYYIKDEYGIEWLGTQNGLVRYDPKTNKNFLVDSIPYSLKEEYQIQDIILLPNAYLLATTYDKGLLLVNRKTFAFKEFHTSQINPQAQMKRGSSLSSSFGRIGCTYKLNDSIILCSGSSGLSIFNWLRGTFTYFKSNIYIYSIFKDTEGIIWLGGQSLEKHDFRDYNIKAFSPAENKKSFKPFSSFFDLYRCSNGKFLMSTYTDFGIYDTLIGFKNYALNKRLSFFK